MGDFFMNIKTFKILLLEKYDEIENQIMMRLTEGRLNHKTIQNLRRCKVKLKRLSKEGIH